MNGERTGLRRDGELMALSEIWLFLLLMGIALMAVGAAAIGSAFIATLATVVVFGVQLLLGGIVQIVASFWGRGWKGFFLCLLSGVLYLVVGLFLIDHPLAAAAGITLVIAAGLLIGGIVRVALALSDRFEGWALVLLSGIVSTLLGLSIWRQWPSSAVWVIGLFVGIELLFSGLSWVSLALAARAASLPALPAGTLTASRP